MTFLSYYLHWSRREVMNLPHLERRRWCKEVSDVNEKISGPSRQQKIDFR